MLERQIINKQKIFYMRESNAAKHSDAVRRLENLDVDLRENMYRMAYHVLQPKVDLGRLRAVALEAAKEQGDKSKAANISKLSEERLNNSQAVDEMITE
jgi:hypothetical protein